MPRPRGIAWLVPVGVATGALIATQIPAFAYPALAASAKLTSGCASVSDGASCTYTFQFFDATGATDDGLSVSFTGHTVSGCSLSPASATTAGGGFAATAFTCAATAGTGTETITASSGSATASVTVSVTANSGVAGASTLPFTGTDPPGPNGWLIAAVAAAAMLLTGGGVYLARTRRAG